MGEGDQRTRVFGIRHHGPGSARSLLAALERFRPDVVLVEGPPDGDAMLLLAADEAMRAPVALMIYDPSEPRRASFYPFASFSPEWVAVRWGLEHGARVRFMDLPIRHQMALDQAGWGEEETGAWVDEVAGRPADPLGLLAQAAGDTDGERWWSRVVEEKRTDDEAFDAIAEAMTALRRALGAGARSPRARRREALREAFMRKVIRAEERTDAERIAVVAGAWHVPALLERPPAKEDAVLLAKLPRQKVEATWVPWSHARLSLRSGYGAGIRSPGWYRHLFASDDRVAERWLTQVARLLRHEGFDVPPASIIDAVRLSEALAALRDRSLAGLEELEEATVSVFLNGRRSPLQLVEEALVVGEVLGEVPPKTPEVPLAADLRREQRRLRLVPRPEPKALVLDLREPSGLAKSHLLRRLELLDIPWGRGGERAEGKGTFKESWTLSWAPELALRVIDAARHGNTVESAATACARALLEKEARLPELVALTERILLAHLPSLVPVAVNRLDRAAAGAADLGSLGEAVPSLARMSRYGDARGTDAEAVRALLDGLLGRLAAGLAAAAVGLAPEPAELLARRIDGVDGALRMLGDEDRLARWRPALERLSVHEGAAPLCRGLATRRLLDAEALPRPVALGRLERALARGASALDSARWLEGFLAGSALLLVHDRTLLSLLDDWLTGLDEAAFEGVLPLLRRTFSSLEAAERRRIGARLKDGLGRGPAPREGEGLDEPAARLGLSVAAWLLGLTDHPPPGGEA